MPIKKGSTSQIRHFFVTDTSSSTGAPLTGLGFNTANLVAYYKRAGSAAVSIPLVTATEGTWVSGGFVACASMPGLYEIHVPNAAFAAGADEVIVYIRGATNMGASPEKIELVAYDPQDAVRLGLGALPNAAAGANGGLPTGNASGQVGVSAIANSAITAAALATDAVQEIQTGLATAQNVVDSGNAVIDALPDDAPTVADIVQGIVTAPLMLDLRAAGIGKFTIELPESSTGEGEYIATYFAEDGTTEQITLSTTVEKFNNNLTVVGRTEV